MRNFDKYSFYIISSISFCVNSDLRFFISRSKLLLPNITFAYSSPCPSFLKRLPSPFFLHILAVRCASPSSPVYPCHPGQEAKNTPKFNTMPSTALPKPVPMSPSQSVLAIVPLKTQKSTQPCSCPVHPALNGYTPPRASRSLSKRSNR